MIAYVRLVRPHNLILLAAAILLGHALAGGEGTGRLVPALLASLFLAAGFYVWNDVGDRDVDRVNRPRRPIPSGAVPVGRARVFALLLLAAALGAGASAGVFPFAVLASWALLLALYEKLWKRRGLAGNVVVSAVAASALLFGARLGGSTAAGIAPALFAFFLHLGREIVKDISDMPGDREGSRRTLPLALGDRRALALSALPLGLLALLSPLPFLLGMYNLFYLVIVIVGVDLLLLCGFVRCLAWPGRPNVGLLSLLLKGQMVVGMTAIFLGSHG